MNNNQGRRRTRRVRQQRKQKNTQISRILLTICMMALVAVVSIGGTIAWLTDETEAVVNTFTDSNVEITLTETNVENNTAEEGVENSYKMIPGNTITKDPKVTVSADSENCYVFVKLEKTTNFDNFMTYTMADGWTELENVNGVYYRTATASNEFHVIKDDQVTVLNAVTKDMMDELTDANYPKLTVTAYAIQQSNGNDSIFNATEAWAAISGN